MPASRIIPNNSPVRPLKHEGVFNLLWKGESSSATTTETQSQPEPRNTRRDVDTGDAGANPGKVATSRRVFRNYRPLSFPTLTYLYSGSHVLRFAIHELSLPETRSILQSFESLYGKPVVLNAIGEQVVEHE